MNERLYFLLGIVAGLLLAQLVIDAQVAMLNPIILPPLRRDAVPASE